MTRSESGPGSTHHSNTPLHSLLPLHTCRFDHYRIHRHILMTAPIAGAHLLDALDDVHSLDHATEYRVAEFCGHRAPVIQKIIVLDVDEQLRGGAVHLARARNGDGPWVVVWSV